MALYMNYLLSSSTSLHDDLGQWKGMMKLKDKVVEEEDNEGDFFFKLSFKQRLNRQKPPSNPSPPKAKQNRK